MVVEQHAPQLQRLRVVLVEQQRLLEALGGRLEVAQFPAESTESRTQWAPRRVQNGAPSWGPTCGETGVPVLASSLRSARHGTCHSHSLSLPGGAASALPKFLGENSSSAHSNPFPYFPLSSNP